MIKFLEFLTGFYWILLPQFIIESLFRARWRQGYQEHGPLGILQEGIKGTLGLNSAVFYVDIYSRWSGHNIKRLLARYDIPMWGWGYAFERFYFRVPSEEAEFVYVLLSEAGVELLPY